MFIKDDIHTLVDVVIINPMHADLLFQCCTTQGFIASNVVQAKEKNYCN
jgi:hypothetical protein